MTRRLSEDNVRYHSALMFCDVELVYMFINDSVRIRHTLIFLIFLFIFEDWLATFYGRGFLCHVILVLFCWQC